MGTGEEVFHKAKWKKPMWMVCILCIIAFLFGKFREISIENKLGDSTIVSISVQEFWGLDNVLTEGPRFRRGSAEFENLAECLGKYQYYKKILPRAGIRGKKIKKST